MRKRMQGKRRLEETVKRMRRERKMRTGGEDISMKKK